MTQKRFLTIVLVTLLVLLAALLVVYGQLQKPLKPVEAQMGKGLDFQFQIFGPSAKDRFKQPTDVAVDRAGNLYVTDTLNDRVCVFDAKGEFLRTFKTGGRRPLGIDVDGSGVVYVVSKRDDLVIAFDAKGKLLRHFPAFSPLNVTEEGGRIYVTTMGPVVSFDAKTAKERRLIGWQGRGKNDFAWPQGIASRDGRLFVADTNNLRIKVLKTDGSVEWTYGKPPTEAQFTIEQGRVFGAPSGIELDELGNMLVLDTFRDRIYVFSPAHKQIADWGGERGDAEGQFDHASGIAYGGEGLLYVADKFNDRVQVFKVVIPGNDRTRGFDLRWLLCLIPLLLLLLALVVNRALRRASARPEGDMAETPGT